MKKILYVVAAVLFVSAAPLLAQGPGGCAGSPENPTIILALVGSAGAAIATARRRFGK